MEAIHPPLSIPPAAPQRPVALPLSLRATEPVPRRPYPIVAIVVAWTIAIGVIVSVCLLV